ncbi:MAG: hypothetical protein ACLRFJ_03980 [Alphaproteobacteria bacterium]
MIGKKKITPGTPEWESICLQCGVCCLVKYIDNMGTIHLTNIRCDMLDPETHKCTCYSPNASQRVQNSGHDSCFKHNGNSLTYETMHQEYLVPGHCPYIGLVFDIKKRPPKPQIDWNNTVPEKSVPNSEIANHIIPRTHKYFKYNPELNKILHKKTKNR